MQKGELVQNSIGYYEFSPKPSESDLATYYNEKYFEAHNYKREYSDKEITHLNLDCLEAEFILNQETGSFLDLGCGEGFFMNFFHSKGWQVQGVDFTTDGIQNQFPGLVDSVQKGNLFEIMDEMVEKGKRYDFLSCNNVLEHVTDPARALNRIASLLTERGVARIKVPNDFSSIQKGIVEKGYAKDRFWVHYPDHLTYFDSDSLVSFIEHSGMKLKKLLSDFPIDFFVFHEKSNYYLDKNIGSMAHQARMDIDITLASAGIEKLVNFREGCAKAGTGRNLVAYITSS